MAGLFSVHLFCSYVFINRSISEFMSFFGYKNFLCTYSLASVMSRLSNTFVFSEEGHAMGRKCLELK